MTGSTNLRYPLLAVSSPSKFRKLKPLNVCSPRNQPFRIANCGNPYPNGRYTPESSQWAPEAPRGYFWPGADIGISVSKNMNG